MTIHRDTQLGITVILFLALAAASLAILLGLGMDSDYNPGDGGRLLWITAALFLLVSIAAGVLGTINRLRDFRKAEAEINRRLEQRAQETTTLGAFTWALLYWQVGAFSLGIVAMMLAFFCVYHGRAL